MTQEEIKQAAALKSISLRDELILNNTERHRAELYARAAQKLFIDGAEWMKEQLEKNRLEHCDNITEEQYNLETGFIDQHLEKYNRMPTFLDAIEYGMKLGKEQMIDKGCEWLNNFYNEDRHCYLVKEDIEAFEKSMMEE